MKFWPIIFLLIISLLFFSPQLFQNKIIVTPAAGLGDVISYNLPFQTIIHDNLKIFRLPLWTDKIYGGLPLTAEPSTHVFYPVSLILLFLFKAPVAYNLNLFISIFFLSVFSYFFTRTLNISELGSLLGAVTLAFSGFVTLRFMHIQLIQVIIWFPAILFCIEKFFQTKSFRFLLYLSIFYALQLLASHPQTTIYCGLVSVSYFLYKLWLSNQSLKQKSVYLFLYILTLILALGLSAIQLIPNFEYMLSSERAGGLQSEEISSYAFHLPELVTFILPYFYGSPANMSYHPPTQDPSLFWETVCYIGVLPFILALMAMRKIKEAKNILFFGILAVISFLFALGKNSPLFFLLLFPPFNLFRAPSRFLFFTTFSLAVLAAFSFSKLISKRSQKTKVFITITVLVFTTADLYYFQSQFNPIDNVSNWLAQPETVQFLKKDSSFYRIYSIDTPSPNTNPYNQVFVQANGWIEDLAPHRHLLNWLPPNTNVYYDINQVNGYASLPLSKQTTLHDLLSQEINTESDKPKISQAGKKLLDLYGTKYILSPFEIEDKNLTLKTQTRAKYNPIIRVYENRNAFPNAFLVSSAKIIKDENKILAEFKKNDFDPAKTVILQKGSELLDKDPNKIEKDREIIKIDKTEEKIIIKTLSTKPEYLVLTDTYYPGWKALIDNKETEVLQADYLFRAVKVPAGNHTIQFYFYPESFKIGLIISLISLSLLIFSFLLRTLNARPPGEIVKSKS